MLFPDGHFPLLHYLSFLLSHRITAKPLKQDYNPVLLSTPSLMNISFPKLASGFSSNSCASYLPQKFPNPSPFPPHLSKELTFRNFSKSADCRDSSSAHEALQIAHCQHQLVWAYHLGAGPPLLEKWGKLAEEKKIFKDTQLASTQMCLYRYSKSRLGIYMQICHLKIPISITELLEEDNVYKKPKARMLCK